MLKFWFETNQSGILILQLLQTFQIFLRNTIQQNIAMVQSWKDKSSSQIYMTGVNINVRTDSVDVPYKPVDGFAQLGNIWLSKTTPRLRIDFDGKTSVSSRRRLMLPSFFKLWWRSNKKFGLVLIQLKFVVNHPMLYVCHTPGELKKVHIEHPQEYYIGSGVT